MTLQLTPFDADVAELVAGIRRTLLEPPRRPELLLSFGRWAVVQRDSLAVRAASPLAVAMVREEKREHLMTLFCLFDFQNRNFDLFFFFLVATALSLSLSLSLSHLFLPSFSLSSTPRSPSSRALPWGPSPRPSSSPASLRRELRRRAERLSQLPARPPPARRPQKSP